MLYPTFYMMVLLVKKGVISFFFDPFLVMMGLKDEFSYEFAQYQNAVFVWICIFTSLVHYSTNPY